MRASLVAARARCGTYVVCVSPTGPSVHALHGRPKGTPIGIYNRAVPIETVLHDIESALAQINHK